ncbi:protein of unknown function [Modicisalibacter ilicicola DSM 19980]|uniref:DUF4434 domain-containing protein n=1 Tax=Modicisalibacter ilicicola DSM 19980 TaxID=1121942 RepID=A0A1M5DVB2_9GAMM|nr:DUF4434 domain-containing protein [Halomonas ilicicola]SHF70860.1 protein of unknown function [Halomonas ilicicola DSM 19980]
MRRGMLAIALWLGALTAQADGTLFYQPQEADTALDQEQWQEVWQRSRDQGVRTLIVQWTRVGEQDFGGSGGWLAAALHAAQDQGLELILGLDHAPDYYQVLPDTQRFDTYWRRQLSLSLAQRRRLLNEWQLDPTAWYLPLELDDWLFREKGTRQELHRQLSGFVARLDRPLHLSAFSGGFLAPSVFADWLASLEALGLKVWWQDGRGTRALPAAVRQAYEDALDCRIGIVHEAFRQTSAEDAPFKADPAPPQVTSTCHPRAVFSLRYRPWAREFFEG